MPPFTSVDEMVRVSENASFESIHSGAKVVSLMALAAEAADHLLLRTFLSGVKALQFQVFHLYGYDSAQSCLRRHPEMSWIVVVIPALKQEEEAFWNFLGANIGQCKGCRVVGLFSGEDDPEIRARFMKLGGTDWVPAWRSNLPKLEVVFSGEPGSHEVEDSEISNPTPEWVPSGIFHCLEVFAGGVAHDFNNLMTTVLGTTELLKLNLVDHQAALKQLEKIQEAARKATHLSQQMLAFSGQNCLKRELMDLNEMVRAFMDESTPTFGWSFEVETILELCATPLMANLHAEQIRQALLNIIFNAMEALGTQRPEMPRQIRIRTYETSISKEQSISVPVHMGESWLAEGKYVVCEIGDNGPGISHQVLPNIFCPFYSTKSTGRGLGLAAALGIVQRHEGGIFVETEVDKGASFRILIPMVEGSELSGGREPSNSMREGSALRILIVDDEDDVREIAAQMLDYLGNQTIQASSGAHSLEILRDQGQDIDFVLLDLNMPEMDGWETSRALRLLLPKIPIVFMSGYNAREEEQWIEGEAFNHFVAKPFSLESLKEICREVNH